MLSIPASPKSVRALEALIRAQGFGATLPEHRKASRPPIPTGLARADEQLGGGLPRGAISEIVGPRSSGRTGLVLAAIARVTQAREVAAYVDATDCLDPRSAEGAGVVLERLLWIRCGSDGRGQRRPEPRAGGGTDDAWQAANLVAAAGGFGVVAIDLGGLAERHLAAWQRKPWLRLRHAVERTPTALIVLSPQCLTGSVADTVLELRRESTVWDGLLDGITVQARVRKSKVRGSFESTEERSA